MLSQAYNCIMDTLEYAHKNYEDAPVTRSKDEDGDLNRMLYTVYGEKELNYKYEIAQEYKYVNEVKSVEDVWIETELHTEHSMGNGKLLMFAAGNGSILIIFMRILQRIHNAVIGRKGAFPIPVRISF